MRVSSLPVLLGLVCSPAALSVAAMGGGSLIPLSAIHFVQDDDVKCLLSALEAGDPATGPSTIVLKMPSGCAVPWHSHTAQEQAIVIRGSVHMGMLNQEPMQLGPGGFGVMEGRVPHQFACTGKTVCIVTVMFNGPYDIVWGKDGK